MEIMLTPFSGYRLLLLNSKSVRDLHYKTFKINIARWVSVYFLTSFR